MNLGPPRFAVAFASFVSLFACAELPDIPSGVCGNGVLDPGEDCDGTVDGRTCGAVSGVGACRFVCTTTASTSGAAPPETACPLQFGCGGDGVCRRSAGTFTLASKDGRAGVDVIALGDFGKQGAKSAYAQSVNVLGLGAPRIFQFDDKGTPLEPGSVPALLGPPQVADMDGDGYADATAIASEGITVLRGTSPISLTPVAFDAYRAPPGASARIGLVTRGLAVTEGTLIATLPNAMGGGPSTFMLAPDTVNAPNPIAALPVSVDQLGTRATSVIDPRKDAPCGLPVFVAKGQPVVVTTEACDLAGEWEQPPLGSPKGPRVLVTTRYEVVDGTWKLRFDDDPHDDILVFTKGHWEVAFGDGLGAFASRPPADPKAEAGRTAVFRITLPVEDAGSSDDEDLAFRELYRRDLTAPLDVGSGPKVLVEGGGTNNVLVVAGRRAVGSTAYASARELSGPDADFELDVFVPVLRTEAWSTARVGDVTGDGFLDVVGGSATNLDLDFVSGTNTLLFNVSRIETGSPTRAMVLGDFDGDRVRDIAFAAPQGTGDNLVIAYGQAFSPPAAQVVVGQYPFIAQIEAANLPPSGVLATYDLTEDIGLVTSTKSDGTGEPTVAILRGSGNRLPLASLGLTEVVPPSAGTPGRPETFSGTARAIAVVRGTGGAPRVDTVAIEPVGGAAAADNRSALRLWTLSGLTSSGLVRAPTVLPGCSTELALVTAAAIDLNADRVDESAFLTLCEGQPALFVIANAGADAKSATVSGPFPVVIPTATNAVIPVALVAGDVDGDDATDLVATFSRFTGDGLEQGLTAIVERIAPVSVVLFNRGGVLDTANPVLLAPTPGTEVPVRAAVFLDMGGPRKQLVVATPSELFVVDGQNGLSYSPFPVQSGTRLDRVRSMAAGDVTGDGVEDLVIGQQPSSLRVLVGGAR